MIVNCNVITIINFNLQYSILVLQNTFVSVEEMDSAKQNVFCKTKCI